MYKSYLTENTPSLEEPVRQYCAQKLLLFSVTNLETE